MTKSTISITLDTELIEKLRQEGVNISGTVNDLLEEYNIYSDKSQPSLEKLIEILDMVDNNMDKLKTFRQKIELYIENIKKQRNELKEKIEDMPELKNISPEKLADNKFMLELVEFVRKKYDVRIGISDIKKYYTDQKKESD